MQEIYGTSQYAVSKNHTVSDARSFVIPQGSKKWTATSQLYTVSYAHVPQVLITFMSEAELRSVLWLLHEQYEQGGKHSSSLSQPRLEFLHHLYRISVEANPPLTGTSILSYLTSPSELPIREHVRVLLSKVHRYIGAGKDSIVDRVYVREKTKAVLAQYECFLRAIEVKVPARVLAGGRKEIVILSDTTAHGHIRSSHIVQYINHADLLLLAIDNNGLTNELASLLVSSRFLLKLTKNPHQIIALDLSSESKGKSAQPRPPAATKELLVAQLKRLFRDIDSASLRNYLPTVLNEMEFLQMKPLLFASLELNNGGSPDKVSLQNLKNSTNMPSLLDRIAAVCPAEPALRSLASMPAPPNPPRPAQVVSESLPPMTTEQLASSLQHRLRVTDMKNQHQHQHQHPTPMVTTTATTITTVAASSAPTSMLHAPVITPSSQPSTTIAPPPPSITVTTPPSFPVVKRSVPETLVQNPHIRAKFEFWRENMFALLGGHECEYAFANKAQECAARALSDWESYFRDRFMSNSDTCSMILDPKFRGECLGVNLNFVLFAPLLSWVRSFWTERVLVRVKTLRTEMMEFSRHLLEESAKGYDSDPIQRIQLATVMQYCQSTMERSITEKLQPLFDSLNFDVSSITAALCTELLMTRLLTQSVEIKGLKRYHQLVLDAMRLLPFELASAIRAKLARLIHAAIPFLVPIEQHMDQLMVNFNTSKAQAQLKNLDPTARQYMQQRMFANMRFGNRPGNVRPLPIGHPAFSSPDNNSKGAHDDMMVDYASPSTGTDHPTLPNAAIASTAHSVTRRKMTNSTPVPPHSPASLMSLCIRTICNHVQRLASLRSGSLPEELVQRVIAHLISDEMSVSIKQLDTAILGKLLDSSLTCLDFENASALHTSSCIEISVRCTGLLKLNLTHCVNINDDSLRYLAALKHLEDLSLEGCYQIGNRGIIAIAQGCRKLCSVNISACTRVNDVAVNELLVNATNLRTLLVRKCTDLTDLAFASLGRMTSSPSPLRRLDLTECRNITDRTACLIGKACPDLAALAISAKDLSDEGVCAVIDGCAGLVELELQMCEAMTNDCVRRFERLSSLRVFMVSGARALSDLAFESDAMTDTTESSASPWPYLHTVSLSKCSSLSDKTVSFFARHCRQLSSLNLSFCAQVTDRSVSELADRCPLLTDVDFTACKALTDAAVVAVARKCSLRTLVLASCDNITDASLFAIAQNVDLHHLDLTQCERITDEGVVKIASGCGELRSLSLAECVNISDLSIVALGAAVDGKGSGCYHLESVRLACCRHVTDASLRKLARGCPNVRVLDLSNCSQHITPEGLRDCLRVWTKLQTLRLKGYHLTTEAIIEGVHPSLKVLNMCWCRNMEDSALINISATCPSLENCNIMRCDKITDDAVARLTANCKNLRQINLTGCKDVTQGFVQMLVNMGKLIYR